MKPQVLWHLMVLKVVVEDTCDQNSYDDDDEFDDCGLTGSQLKFANAYDISLRGQLRQVVLFILHMYGMSFLMLVQVLSTVGAFGLPFWVEV